MKSDRFDAIIVGFGLAGALVAHQMEKRGLSFVICDDKKPSASSASAGILNPITGRRYVLSWNVNTLIESAQRNYAELEYKIDDHLFIPVTIVRHLPSDDALINWQERIMNRQYVAHTATSVPVNFFDKISECAYIRGFKLKAGALLDKYLNYLETCGVPVFGEFDRRLFTFEGKYSYDGIQADHIIFCDGAGIFTNPFVRLDGISGNKGQAIRVRSRVDLLSMDVLFKSKIFVVPFGVREYWIGAYNQWEFEHTNPDDQALDFLTSRLRFLGGNQFDVVEQMAGIRVVTKDRRPLVGEHPEIKGMYFLNGLGTKGTSLAPYCAEELCKMMFDGTRIAAEIDVQRFWVGQGP